MITFKLMSLHMGVTYFAVITILTIY